MKNILVYLNKHKWIIIVLIIVIIFSIILAEKLSNKPKVIERLTCSALNDVKIIDRFTIYYNKSKIRFKNIVC